LLNYEFVALRFLSQASYEQAAQMRVSPAPDVITRVFLLFRGVAADYLGLWEQAATRATAEDGAAFWPQSLVLTCSVRPIDYSAYWSGERRKSSVL
jgi:hypothetical protein